MSVSGRKREVCFRAENQNSGRSSASRTVRLRSIADMVRWPIWRDGPNSSTISITLLAPPLVLFAIAHLGLSATRSPILSYAALLGVWAAGIGALLWSGWPRRVLAWVGVALCLVAVPLRDSE